MEEQEWHIIDCDDFMAIDKADELDAWVTENAGELLVDWKYDDIKIGRYYFRDPAFVTLFKLTWG